MLILAVTFTLLSALSFLIRNSTYFTFAALAPCAAGCWLITLNPEYRYISIHPTAIMCFVAMGSILIFFDIASYFLGSRLKLNLVRGEKYLLACILLGIGIFGYVLKLSLHVPDVGLTKAIAIIFLQPEKFSKLFASGFSIVHYTGLLGLVYFGLLAPKRSLRYLAVLFLVIIYLLSLFMLFIKVQIVIGLYILFWTFALSSDNPRRVMINGGLLIIFLGACITLYDNIKVSNDLSIAFEFLIRYLGGSIIGFSEFISSTRQLNAVSFEGYFLGRYNPLLAGFGVETFEFPEKIFYQIGENAGTVNTGTILQSLILDLGYIGWIFGILFFSLIVFASRLISSKSSILSGILFPFLIISQVGFSMIHIGNAFWKFELIFIFFLHGVLFSVGMLCKKIKT